MVFESKFPFLFHSNNLSHELVYLRNHLKKTFQDIYFMFVRYKRLFFFNFEWPRAPWTKGTKHCFWVLSDSTNPQLYMAIKYLP